MRAFARVTEPLSAATIEDKTPPPPPHTHTRDRPEVTTSQTIGRTHL